MNAWALECHCRVLPDAATPLAPTLVVQRCAALACLRDPFLYIKHIKPSNLMYRSNQWWS
jgi:hypothetical protein